MSENQQTLVILSVGTNVGNRKKNLEDCISLLQKLGSVEKFSLVYESEGWGNKELLPFYNICMGLLTDIPAFDFFSALQETEKQLGRTAKTKPEQYENRIIDIDIVFFGNQIIQNEIITIPHKEIQNRRFVLAPLAEIYPNLRHPLLNLNVSELLNACNDASVLTIIDNK